jgi:hypothetical protein
LVIVVTKLKVSSFDSPSKRFGSQFNSSNYVIGIASAKRLICNEVNAGSI